jgi:hypothetical protein
VQELPPFSMRNRPWLTQGCIDAINERYMSYVGKIDPADRENLREWAANQAEIGYHLDHPDVIARCKEWGELRSQPR